MTDPKKSDLPVRAASAVVMVAVAGTALWLGGWVWSAFVAAVALGVLWEWRGLVVRFEALSIKRLFWYAGGLVYVGLAAITLVGFRLDLDSPNSVLQVAGSVIATDIGAYFAGRAIGGPKIAPRISPSKTWAGLGGGILGAATVMILADFLLWLQAERQLGASATGSFIDQFWQQLFFVAVVGALIAITAQTGDFFESWMKRRAGVKDSGNLIPGHGGLFDRVDGLLAVCFVLGLLSLPVYF